MFERSNQAAYDNWATEKLRNWPQDETALAALTVTISNPRSLSVAEKTKLLMNCQQTNLSFYRFTNKVSAVTPETLMVFWQQLGMRELNRNICADSLGVSHIQVEPKTRYIPYTDKPLKWHTDGCYNEPEQTIQSFAMHCVSAADSGGSNRYFDPEILYILLRNENPDYITALSHPQALTIPANEEHGRVVRPAVSVPALRFKPTLSLRYSERVRNIQWRDDPLLSEALLFIQETLLQDSIYQIERRLEAGEGVICNNVLHNRSAFTHEPRHPRLLYRARFYNRINQRTTEDIK